MNKYIYAVNYYNRDYESTTDYNMSYHSTRRNAIKQMLENAENIYRDEMTYWSDEKPRTGLIDDESGCDYASPKHEYRCLLPIIDLSYEDWINENKEKSEFKFKNRKMIRENEYGFEQSISVKRIELSN